MSKWLWNALLANPVVLGVAFLIANSAFASEILNTDSTAEKNNITRTDRSITIVKAADGNLIETLDFEAKEPQVSLLIEEEKRPSPKLDSQTLVEEPPASEKVTTEFMPESLEILEGDSTDEPMEQITNVTQLSDVVPGDWAYEALRSLVERYGCIAGYPDGTFRGNRAMTRYEFAAGVNACLQQIERLIATSTSEFIRREDLETLRRIAQEFQAEIATLDTQIDTLESRVAFLEDHQFSVTTKLVGSADFGLIDAWGDERAVPSGQTPTEDLEINTFAPGRVGLVFDTSFTGRDLLRTKLEAGNFTPLDASITGTDMTLYDFDTRTGPTGNDVVLGTLLYKFPIGTAIEVFLAPQGLGSPDVAPQLNPAGGGLSRFGQRNPIYRISDGAGVGVNVRFSEAVIASFTYLSPSGNLSNPNSKRGLFDGQFGALAQLTLTPISNFDIAFTYIRYYSPQPGEGINLTGNTGSGFAQTPFGDDVATSANAYGIEVQYRLTPNISLGGWVGVTKAQAETSGVLPNGVLVNQGDEAEIWNYAVALAWRDFGRKGNALGLIFGMPPRIRGNDIVGRRDLDTSYRAEAFYRYQVTDNITITPSFFVVFNPEHNNANDAIAVGTLLTTFSF
jgi:hypothetical protein